MAMSHKDEAQWEQFLVGVIPAIVSKGCPDWLMFSSDGQVTELAISHHAAPIMQMKADV